MESQRRPGFRERADIVNRLIDFLGREMNIYIVEGEVGDI